MKLLFTIFYSWQSDLDATHNRNFILTTLEKAATAIGRENSIVLDAVVDRDTMGLPGSPSIADSIAAKIAKSDLFIADVSIVTPQQNTRPMPNSNVVFELGYAVAHLGWDRIILVQNTRYGGPEKLPFDLRGRRIATYEAPEAANTAQKQQLKDKLFHTFKEVLRYSESGLPPKERPVWWGSWEQRTFSQAAGSALRITRVSSDAFFFHLLLVNGARSGVVQGRAKILTPHSAFARIETADGEYCEFSFQRHLEHDRWQIVIEEGEQCRYFHGVGVSFSGTYLQNKESVIDRGFLDELDLNELERMCGSYLPLLFRNFSTVQDETWQSSGERYTNYTGFAKGMYSTTRTRIVVTDWGKVWCFVYDSDKAVVRYFHNTPEAAPPPFIYELLEAFAGTPVVVNDPGDPYLTY